MPFFSLERDIVFIPDERPVYIFGDFPDFYALLQLPRTASREEIENAILESGSQLLAASLARGKSERIRLLEHYLPLLRRALLDAAMRAQYNALLLSHQHSTADQAETDAFFEMLWAHEREKDDQNWTFSVRPLARLWRRNRATPERHSS